MYDSVTHPMPHKRYIPACKMKTRWQLNPIMTLVVTRKAEKVQRNQRHVGWELAGEKCVWTRVMGFYDDFNAKSLHICHISDCENL